MSQDNTSVMFAAVIDSLTLLQGQLDTVQDRLDGIEDRLNTIDSGQASLTDVEPALQLILAKQIDNDTAMRHRLATVARVAAFAYAAASGSPAQLPSDLLSDPLLERFRREMPAERRSPERALARWREEVVKAATSDLARALIRQYETSPTETVDHVAMRYRMAAISREELERRFVDVPVHPAGHVERDTSSASRMKRGEHLAAVWRKASPLLLYGEAELAHLVDLIEQLEATENIDRETVEGMREKVGEHLAAGQQLAPRRVAPFGDANQTLDRDGPER